MYHFLKYIFSFLFTQNVYQARLVPKALPPYTQLQTSPSDTSICQQNSTAENSCNQSSISNRNKDRNTSCDNAQHVTESCAYVNPDNQLVSDKLSSSCTNSKSTVHVNCDEHTNANTPVSVDLESDSPEAESPGMKCLSANKSVQEHSSMPENVDKDSNTNTKETQPDAAVNSAGNSSTDSALSAGVTSAGLTAKTPNKSDRSACAGNVSDSVKPPDNNVLASSSSHIGLDDKLTTHSAQEAAKEMLHFLNCEMVRYCVWMCFICLGNCGSIGVSVLTYQCSYIMFVFRMSGELVLA